MKKYPDKRKNEVTDVEAVKSLGFILDSEEEGNGYQAYNSDGICITVVYNAMDEIMEISVEVE